MTVETAAPVAAPAPVAPAATEAAPVVTEVKPAESKPTETAPAKVEAPKVDPTKTAAFLALSKREKAIVEMEKKAKAEIAAKEAEVKTKSEKFAELERLTATAEKKDYAAILGKLGISYEDLTKWYVQGGKEAVETATIVSKETKALEDKLAAQQKRLEDMEAARAEADKKAAAAEEKRQVEASRAFVVDKIKADPKFELLNLSGQAAKVYETMVEVVTADPARADTPEKANALMLEVAEALEAGILAEHQALSKAQKLGAKAAAEAKADDKSEGKKDEPTLSRAERRAKALATLEGKELTAAPPAVVSTRPKTRAELIAEIAAKMG